MITDKKGGKGETLSERKKGIGINREGEGGEKKAKRVSSVVGVHLVAINQ